MQNGISSSQSFPHGMKTFADMSATSHCYDDPSQSCAASCISLSLHILEANDEKCTNEESYDFRPKFTHQCFPGEYIQGYLPPHDIVDSLVGHRHSSFGSFGNESPKLLIRIEIAPSCLCCTMQIEIKESDQKHSDIKRLDFSESVVTFKRKTHDDESIEIPNKSKKLDIIGSAVDHAVSDDNEYYTRSPMPTDDIKVRLEKALPPVKTSLPEREKYLSEPIGAILEEFCIKSCEKNVMDFVVTFATGVEACEYHRHVQKLSLFYIESASVVDILDIDEGGYWKVLYVFRKHVINGSYRYSFVAYMTLYHFHSPFRKPNPGVVVRICQALVLPPYQRLGIGRRILRTLYGCFIQSQASSNHDDMHSIVEVNVEDPAPGFVALRDLVDYERFLELGNSWFKSVHSLNHTLTLEDNIRTTKFFKPLSDLDASEVATKLFIATRQVMVVFELDRLYTLQKFVKSRPKIATDIKEKLYKDYRLMVKHRLRNQEMELLHSCTSKQAMKDMLTAMYDESFSRYSSILTRVHR